MSLAFLSWLGTNINNIFLTYVVITVLLLIPGLEYNGILIKYGNALSNKVTEYTAQAKCRVSGNNHTKTE